MFVLAWYASRYSLCVSTRWHSYCNHDPKILCFHSRFINHIPRWIQILHFWNTVFVLCQKITACLRPGWWSALVLCFNIKILIRTFVQLSCVVTVLQSSMFWISLCVRNVSLALSLPAWGPFYGLDVQFLLEKKFASLTLNIFITDCFREPCENECSEFLSNIIINLNRYNKKHFHRLIFFRSSSWCLECFSCFFPLGPVCSICVSSFGARPVAIFSGFMVAGGLMMSSFAPNIYFLYVSYGIVVGKKHVLFILRLNLHYFESWFINMKWETNSQEAVVVWDLVYQRILYFWAERDVARAGCYHVVKDKNNVNVHEGLKTVCSLLTELLEMEKLRFYLRAGIEQGFCWYEMPILKE